MAKTIYIDSVKIFLSENSFANLVIIGDLNVRLGNLQQDVDDFFKSSFTAGLDVRCSNDTTVNTKGKEFLEFCNDNGLIILNGRTKGDEEGDKTYVSTIGESVNDIMCRVTEYVDVG